MIHRSNQQNEGFTSSNKNHQVVLLELKPSRQEPSSIVQHSAQHKVRNQRERLAKTLLRWSCTATPYKSKDLSWIERSGRRLAEVHVKIKSRSRECAQGDDRPKAVHREFVSIAHSATSAAQAHHAQGTYQARTICVWMHEKTYWSTKVTKKAYFNSRFCQRTTHWAIIKSWYLSSPWPTTKNTNWHKETLINTSFRQQ